jgi:hypothetical protein
MHGVDKTIGSEFSIAKSRGARDALPLTVTQLTTSDPRTLACHPRAHRLSADFLSTSSPTTVAVLGKNGSIKIACAVILRNQFPYHLSPNGSGPQQRCVCATSKNSVASHQWTEFSPRMHHHFGKAISVRACIGHSVSSLIVCAQSVYIPRFDTKS